MKKLCQGKVKSPPCIKILICETLCPILNCFPTNFIKRIWINLTLKVQKIGTDSQAHYSGLRQTTFGSMASEIGHGKQS